MNTFPSLISFWIDAKIGASWSSRVMMMINNIEISTIVKFTRQLDQFLLLAGRFKLFQIRSLGGIALWIFQSLSSEILLRTYSDSNGLVEESIWVILESFEISDYIFHNSFAAETHKSASSVGPEFWGFQFSEFIVGFFHKILVMVRSIFCFSFVAPHLVGINEFSLLLLFILLNKVLKFPFESFSLLKCLIKFVEIRHNMRPNDLISVALTEELE